MTDHISAKDHELFLETVNKRGPFDEILFVSIVELAYQTDKKKMKKRVVCCTRYRVLTFAKSTLPKGKYSLEKEYLILDLLEITSEHDTQATLKFKPTKEGEESIVKVIYPGVSILLKVVRESFRKITYGIPQENEIKLSIKDEYLLSDYVEPPVGLGNGFIDSYYAYCNLHSIAPSESLVMYVTDIVNSKSYDLDLTKLPGIDTKGELAVELLPVAESLKYNTYFRSFIIKDVPHKEVAECVSIFMKTNKTISYINISNTGSEVPELFGQSLLANCHHNKLSMIDLSASKIKESSFVSFACGLQQMHHGLTVLNLEGASITPKSITVLFRALQNNPGMALKIQELNLSHIKMDSEGSGACVEWLHDVSRESNLKRLSLANTGITTGLLMMNKIMLKLHYLDISDNKFDKMHFENLHSIAADFANMEVVRLSNIGLPMENICKFIREIGSKNTNISGEFSLDLSRNMIHSHVPLLSEQFRNLGDATKLQNIKHRLTHLDLSDTIKGKCNIKELLESLPISLKSLYFNQNFNPSSGEDDSVFVKSLGEAINRLTSLSTLTLSGTKEKKMGKKIVPFFDYLKKNKSLTYLDISRNGLGNQVIATLCDDVLRTNTTLRYLNLDKNDLTLNGLLKLRHMLNYNTTILNLKYNFIDFLRKENSSNTSTTQSTASVGGIPSSFSSEIIVSDILRVIFSRSTSSFDDTITKLNPFKFSKEYHAPIDPPPLAPFDQQYEAIAAQYREVIVHGDKTITFPEPPVGNSSDTSEVQVDSVENNEVPADQENVDNNDADAQPDSSVKSDNNEDNTTDNEDKEKSESKDDEDHDEKDAESDVALDSSSSLTSIQDTPNTPVEPKSLLSTSAGLSASSGSDSLKVSASSTSSTSPRPPPVPMKKSTSHQSVRPPVPPKPQPKPVKKAETLSYSASNALQSQKKSEEPPASPQASTETKNVEVTSESPSPTSTSTTNNTDDTNTSTEAAVSPRSKSSGLKKSSKKSGSSSSSSSSTKKKSSSKDKEKKKKSISSSTTETTTKISTDGKADVIQEEIEENIQDNDNNKPQVQEEEQVGQPEPIVAQDEPKEVEQEQPEPQPQVSNEEVAEVVENQEDNEPKQVEESETVTECVNPEDEPKQVEENEVEEETKESIKEEEQPGNKSDDGDNDDNEAKQSAPNPNQKDAGDNLEELMELIDDLDDDDD
eukprot:TRINITY_DN6666_c0_g1_i1.p1 TRINITY_DN6666_c0_g1~~TRINITY_DN6666_c0_g1_i1.p1  ORF type:complete len:1190 (+),score=323.85 TRINITY_DN6666_c0_g1_i1:85-3654(+)